MDKNEYDYYHYEDKYEDDDYLTFALKQDREEREAEREAKRKVSLVKKDIANGNVNMKLWPGTEDEFIKSVPLVRYDNNGEFPVYATNDYVTHQELVRIAGEIALEMAIELRACESTPKFADKRKIERCKNQLKALSVIKKATMIEYTW